MKFNKISKSILLNTDINKIDLNIELENLAEKGFIEKDGCHLLEGLHNINKHIPTSEFTDKTGYEAFINSVNIDDYTNENLLENGILFTRKVLKKWNHKNGTLTSIIIMDELSTKVKIYLSRENENWLSDDIESYEEGIIIMHSN